MDIFDAIATERRRLADDLETLTPEQWSTPSQCAAWDVRQAAVHTLLPLSQSTPQFFARMIRSRFDLDRMAINGTAELAERTTNEQIIARLRAEADNRWEPPIPGIGAEIPLSEIVVHAQDIRIPLGLGCPIPQATIDLTLESVKNDEAREDYRRRIGA